MSAPNKQKDSRIETMPNDTKHEVSQDEKSNSLLDIAPIAVLKNEDLTLKDAVKPKSRRKKKNHSPIMQFRLVVAS